MPGQARLAVCVPVLFPVADLAEPPHYDICDLKIVLIKHHHVRITFDAVVRKQKKLCVTAGSLDRVDGGKAAFRRVSPLGPNAPTVLSPQNESIGCLTKRFDTSSALSGPQLPSISTKARTLSLWRTTSSP